MGGWTGHEREREREKILKTEQGHAEWKLDNRRGNYLTMIMIVWKVTAHTCFRTLNHLMMWCTATTQRKSREGGGEHWVGGIPYLKTQPGRDSIQINLYAFSRGVGVRLVTPLKTQMLGSPPKNLLDFDLYGRYSTPPHYMKHLKQNEAYTEDFDQPPYGFVCLNSLF